MEQLLKHHKVVEWPAEKLLDAIAKALPKSREEGNPDLIRNSVRKSITDGGGLTGEQLINMMIDLVRPGASSLDKHETFQRVFGTNLDVFFTAETGCRSPIIFLEALFNGIVLESCHLVVKSTERMIFDVIGQENRARDFDTFFPSGEMWCIACGVQQPVDYKSGKSGVHGCAIAPAGWLRLGLKVDGAAAARGIEGDEWTTWHKAYHGTAGQNLRSIVDSGLIFGDGQHGKAGAQGKKVIYASPSLEYSAHYVYTSDTAKIQGDAEAADKQGEGGDPGDPASPGTSSIASDWSSMLGAVVHKDGAYAQFVFEVRVRPGKYRIQGNTLAKSLWPNRKLPFESKVLSDNLEWIIEDASDMLCTGVMIRQLTCKPQELNTQRIEEMKQFVGWDEASETCKRPRNYGDVPAGREVVWAYNDAPKSTLSYADSAPWKRYPANLSKIIEGAYQAYQCYAFLGQPEGAPGPYIVDFGSEFDPGRENHPEQRRADADKEQAWRRRAVRRMAA